MEITPLVYVVAPVVVFAGYVVFGISGFGATIIIVPLLAQLLPLKFVVPLLVLLDLGATIIMRASKATHDRNLGEIGLMLPFMLAGMAMGAYLLVAAPERWLMLTLGLFVTGYAVLALLRNPQSLSAIPRWYGPPLALLGGIGSSVFGTGGPVYAIYVCRRLHDPSAMRATMSTIIAISVLVRIMVFAMAGLLLKAEVGLAAMVLLVFMAGGIALGMRLHSRMKAYDIHRVVQGLLAVSGGSLILRALMLAPS